MKAKPPLSLLDENLQNSNVPGFADYAAHLVRHVQNVMSENIAPSALVWDVLHKISGEAAVAQDTPHDPRLQALKQNIDCLSPMDIDFLTSTVCLEFGNKKSGEQQLIDAARTAIAVIAIRKTVPVYGADVAEEGQTPGEYFEKFYRSCFTQCGIETTELKTIDPGLYGLLKKGAAEKSTPVTSPKLVNSL